MEKHIKKMPAWIWRKLANVSRIKGYKQCNTEDKILIPAINELLDKLHRSSNFSKLDLKLAPIGSEGVNDANIHKMTFRTHKGHYGLLLKPFDLTNAAAIFQSHMNDIF